VWGGERVSERVTVTLTVNGREVTRTTPAHTTLLAWLRDHAAIYDPKPGCGEGVCGACSVLVDGEPVSSCLVLAAQVDGAEVRTVSGLSFEGTLSPLQRAFLERGAAQCGFCTPGMLTVATALLREGRELDRDEIREALHGNICRCTGYQAIVSAVADAAGEETVGGD
jgi:carbon-monoxide dehydrogenase small subunit